MDCRTLTNPANGQVSTTAGTTFGETATYSCNTGYNRVGDNTRMCQATGVWSGSAPTCQSMFLYTIVSWASSHGRLQLKHQKLRVGGCTEEACLNGSIIPMQGPKGYGWVCVKLCCQMSWCLKRIRTLAAMYMSSANLLLIHCARILHGGRLHG